MVRFRRFGAKKSFLKNAWDGCGKRDKLRVCNSLHVPNTLGTSLGQVGTMQGHAGLSPAFAILHLLSRCVGPWDNGTAWDTFVSVRLNDLHIRDDA